MAHLVLYHLSVCCKKKYFDFDREILPFTSENWDSLLLGEVRVLKFGNRGGMRNVCSLTHFPSSFSSQTLPRENVLPSSFLLLTATRTGESEEGGSAVRCYSTDLLTFPLSQLHFREGD